MKEELVKRLDELKKQHNGFSNGMRWGKSGSNNFIDVDYRKLSDPELLLFFERVIRRHYIQM